MKYTGGSPATYTAVIGVLGKCPICQKPRLGWAVRSWVDTLLFRSAPFVISFLIALPVTACAKNCSLSATSLAGWLCFYSSSSLASLLRYYCLYSNGGGNPRSIGKRRHSWFCVSAGLCPTRYSLCGGS